MKALSGGTNINFIGQRWIAYSVSVVVILVCVFALVTRGLNFGIDFTGGTLVEVGYQEPIELGVVRGALRDAGFDDAVVQSFGTPRDILIRLAPREGVSNLDLSNDVLEALKAGPQGGTVDLRRIEFVGAQVSEDLAESGGLAVLYAMIGILIYVALRFEKRLAVAAVLGLAHDTVVILGVFALFQLDFDLTVLAAILAVIGYSLNDTIVIFDRIRENFRKMRKGTPAEIVNIAVNDTLARTIVTSLTTAMVIVALYFLGGELLRNFSIALLIGIAVGVYSTVYIASALSLALGITKADLMPVQKEGGSDEEAGGRP